MGGACAALGNLLIFCSILPLTLQQSPIDLTPELKNLIVNAHNDERVIYNNAHGRSVASLVSDYSMLLYIWIFNISSKVPKNEFRLPVDFQKDKE